MAGIFNQVDQNNFLLPGMGDYYDEDLNEEFLKNVNSADPKKAFYYIEDPYSTSLGYHPEAGCFVLKARPYIPSKDIVQNGNGKEAYDLNYIDGDTMLFALDSVNDGGNPFEIEGEKFKGFREYCYQKMSMNDYKDQTFKIRCVGIDAPEVCHYDIIAMTKEDYDNGIIELTFEEIKKYDGAISYDKGIKRDYNTKYKFMKLKSSSDLHEIIGDKMTQYPYPNSEKGKKMSNRLKNTEHYFIKYVNKDDEDNFNLENGKNWGETAKNTVVDMMSTSEDMIVVLDATQLTNKGGYSGPYQVLKDGINEDTGMFEIMKAYMQVLLGDNLYKYPSFSTFGQDAYKRFLGTIYVKKKIEGADKSVWINLSKYLLASQGDHMELKLGLTPANIASGNGVSDAFKVWSYRKDNYRIIDGFYETEKSDFDDRREIQKQISGMDFELYKDYTVMIGDCMFMVPPTSIRIVNSINSDRVSLLRSKATMVKERPHVDRVLEIKLYFNNEEGINGVPIKRMLPSGEGGEVTYHMNGLRTLISMFRLTPFLPIENQYINNDLNIEAVTLNNLDIKTIKGFPKCIEVTLTLQQFNYRVFLPDLPVPDPDRGEKYDKNMFATCIDYELMRYYYQKPIQRGENLLGVDTLSEEYIKATMGSRTNLVPCTFRDSSISFSILDEEWLKRKLAVKQLAAKRPLQQTAPISNKVSMWGNEVSKSMNNLSYVLPHEINVSRDDLYVKFKDAISDANNKLKSNGKNPLLLSVQVAEEEYNKVIVYANYDMQGLTQSELNNLMKIISKENDNYDMKDVFVGGRLILTYKKINYKDGKIVFQLDGDANYDFMKFIAFRGKENGPINIEDNDWADFGSASNEYTLQNIKDNGIDMETSINERFVGYPLSAITPESFSVTMSNTMSNIKLQAMEGYAPQYAGGKDTIVEFNFITKSRETINSINAMQSIAAQQLITYRQVINCWPVRIDSEFTKLCGINEVIIESIDVTTIPNIPGAFNVSIRAVSVDRTMRNREALNRIDEMDNSGVHNPTGTADLINKTYFDLNRTLSKAEVYPDLELPTIAELEQAGFRFISYMNNKNNRSYPDPDFYFIYQYVYSSQLTRKMIVDYFTEQAINNEENKDLSKSSNLIINSMAFHQDSSNNQTLYTSLLPKNSKDKNKILDMVYSNKEEADKYKKELSSINEMMRKIQGITISSDNKLEVVKAKLGDKYVKTTAAQYALLSFNIPSWDISNDIKCTFAESVTTQNRDLIEQDASANSIANATAWKNKQILDLINDRLSKPIVDKKWCKIIPGSKDENDSYHDVVKMATVRFIEGYDDTESSFSTWISIFDLLGYDMYQKFFNNTSDIRNKFAAMLEGAAMAMSGNIEYSPNAPKQDYESRGFVYKGSKDGEDTYSPYSIIIDNDTKEQFLALDIETAKSKGVTFGPYQIRKYDPVYLKSLYSDRPVNFEGFDFLDPYYNKTLNPKVDQESYKEKLIDTPDFSVEAFSRIALVWLKILIENKALINYYDANREEFKAQFKGIYDALNGSQIEYYRKGSKKTITKQKEQDIIKKEAENIEKFLAATDDYDYQLVLGKLFSAMTLAVTNGDKLFLGNMLERDTGTLNAIVESCASNINSKLVTSEGQRVFRKFVRSFAVTRTKLIDNDLSNVGRDKYTSPLENVIRDNNEKLWIDASNDPSLWIMHSYYDMVVNNKRGRMARAFPTYYMMFIDEGREIGYWKIRDNFYNVSAISEIEVIKSRKMPIETATIGLTNMFKTYDTDDEDIKTDYQTNIKDVFNSIFSPRTYFNELEDRRNEQMNINKIKLKPGARIHLRMGYSGDASTLPILFNGVVADVVPGEIMQLTCESDGHEIASNGVFGVSSAEDAAELKNEGSICKWFQNFFMEGATPKTLMKNVLTTKSGVIGNIVNWYTSGRFFNDNMFGVTHFGEIDFKQFHRDGEVMQNIYEGEGCMPWDDVNSDSANNISYSSQEPPMFTIDLNGKSVWDVLNVSANSSLEFIAAVAPFGLRNTIFHGRPHYYYAYDYGLTENKELKEKRKPYQQYHLIDSYSDIIGNSIQANAKDVKTVAVPSYKGPGLLNKTINKKTPFPLYIDWDIYPEFQKTMVVDTQMTYKGNKAGFILYNYFSDNFSVDGGQKTAWRMGANALKNSVKDMYQGEVEVIGDPVIKPFDKIYLQDIFLNMNGAFEVEAVVHRMTPETGFTSSIFADCISHVDDRFSKAGDMVSKKLMGTLLAAKTMNHFISNRFYSRTKPMMNTIGKALNMSNDIGRNLINNAAKIAGKDELIRYGSMEKWKDGLLKSLNINKTELEISSEARKLSSIAKSLGGIDIKDISSAKDVVDIISNMSYVYDSDRMNSIRKGLEDRIGSGRLKGKKLEDAKKALREINSMGGINSEMAKSLGNTLDDAIKKVNELKGTEKSLTKAQKEALEELMKIKSKGVDASNVKQFASAMDEFKDVIDIVDEPVVKNLIKHSDDIAKTADKVKDALSIVRLGVVGGEGVSAILTGGLSLVAEFAIEYVITKGIYNYIENVMAGLNVLTIHPLKKNGVVHVAGINGHKGLVIGSPTWNSEGLADQAIKWAFKDRGPVYDIFKGLFFSENMTNISKRYFDKEKLGVANTVNENLESGQLQAMAESIAAKHAAAQAIALTPRLLNTKDAAAKFTFMKTTIKRADSDQVKNELVPITLDNKNLQKYFESGLLNTVHNMNLKQQVNSMEINSKNFGDIKCNAIERPYKNGHSFDIPFLRSDASLLLTRILEEFTYEMTTKKYGSDSKKTLILKMGTRCGEDTWASTGYLFRIEIPGYDHTQHILDELKNEYRNLYVSQNKDVQYGVFEYKKTKSKDGKSDVFDIFVSPKNEYMTRNLNEEEIR